MELPVQLRQAVDRFLEGTPLDALRTASQRLTGRYRSETRDGRQHLDGTSAVKAYLAARLPATYAAVRSSMGYVAEAAPDFSPTSLLDIGAGPGTALWAAADCWDGIGKATMVEASEAVRSAGQALATEAALPVSEWLAGDAVGPLPKVEAAELITLSYVLDELAPAAIGQLVDRLWALTSGLLLIVEPGTPAGWSRILVVRERLIALGARILAPCPHEKPCPLVAPDWCHFSRRVARSRLHRLTKGADVPWEDEKFIYLAASRASAPDRAARILAPPRAGKGRIGLKLCLPDGAASGETISKRDGEVFKRARRLDWGDRLPVEG
jgi:ribosomal protein RSM22 (predicted rRNA methylase)